MKRMTVDELYEYLCSPLFLDEKSGNIFYNYYIYQYPASQEYEMRRQIQEFKQKLERPTNFVNALVLDCSACSASISRMRSSATRRCWKTRSRATGSIPTW